MNRKVTGRVDLWRQAKTLEDLGELTARWIEGTLDYYPGYGGPIDAETIPLQHLLAEFNRSGFVTTFSQPAAPLRKSKGGSYGQRACVQGYAQEVVAKRIAALGLYTDLLVLDFPPGDYTYGYQIPITVTDFHPFTWCGGYYGDEELDELAEEYSPEAMSALAGSWRVTVIDSKWGRKSYLWDRVLSAVRKAHDGRFDVTPSPDLEIGQDFHF